MIPLSAILAQTRLTQRLKSLEDAFKQANTAPPDWGTIAVLITVLAAVIFALVLTRRIRQRQSGELFAKRPYKLFAYALRELGVRYSDRVLARMAARSCGLRQPTVMLFSPDLMESTIGHWANSLALGPLRRHARERFNVIAAKAFPQPADSATT